MRHKIYIILISLVFFGGKAPDKPSKYIPGSERKKERLATPEEGTYLRPGAHIMLKELEDYMKHPEDHKVPSSWIRNIFVSPNRMVKDTVISLEERMVPLRLYYPSKKSLQGNQPVILFLHGGGFVFGSVEYYHVMASKIARVSGRIVVSVEYSLAPDHPFPSGLIDCFTALCWLQGHAARIGADADRICLMGDSAGGNLATVLTLMCRDRGRPQPMCQVLLYPATTFVEDNRPSMVLFGYCKERIFVLDEDLMRRIKRDYLGETGDERDPYVSPLEGDLSPDLAPALIITAECDPLRDDGREYAKRLKESGVRTEHIEYSGMIHGFMSFHMIFREGVKAMKYTSHFIEESERYSSQMAWISE